MWNVSAVVGGAGVDTLTGKRVGEDGKEEERCEEGGEEETGKVHGCGGRRGSD